ncbi:hypothetical protein F0L17_14205 [Streptomyces sp. TRM43335]|uniref:GIY-YIG nuclease family protein n=1 Tax=Streptomyces taklimakanensis TaxID=2569853 RepID=A0A6G2BDB8_9ACTN|nr:GIY-YIG nuclease family protein [Streptomyces taklimakanensis]MTE20240.1 hypothetical protein [Streptomyces taklimakanensis]
MLYVVVDEVHDAVKFGITSGDPRPRLAVHARDGYDTVARLVTDLPDAREMERRILAALRDAGEQPIRGREYYPARVLPMVLDLVDNSPRETPTPGVGFAS